MPQTIKIKLTPRAKQNKILGWKDDVLRVHITAPPVDGNANHALVAFLAKEFGVSKSEINIIKGHASREKFIEIPDNVSALQNKLI
tara:strand:- start:55 stop:312 length:258 start_codon:yes stop_codon:yes gene_type:complete